MEKNQHTCCNQSLSTKSYRLLFFFAPALSFQMSWFKFMATFAQARLSGIVKDTSCAHYFDNFTNCDLLVPLNGAPPGWLVKSIIFCLSTTHPPTTWLIRLTRKYRNVKARNPKMQKHKYLEYVLFADSHHPATTSSCSSD